MASGLVDQSWLNALIMADQSRLATEKVGPCTLVAIDLFTARG
jgi:hypothetical protein